MQRHERIESDIKNSIYDIIINEIKNSNVKGMITITSVKVTKDLKYAKVHTSIFNANKEKTIDALNSSSKFIRGMLSKKVKIRNTPELTFVVDDSMEYGAYMDKKIKDLK